MARKWTAEQKAKQSTLICGWAPWKESTGPVTPEGKAKASRNGYKGGKAGKELRWMQALRELSAAKEKVKKLKGTKSARLLGIREFALSSPP